MSSIFSPTTTVAHEPAQQERATTYETSENNERLNLLVPADRPDIDALETEDETPVDNIFSAKQQRLLVESLYSSWKPADSNRSFLADANIGLFFTVKHPPLVPDVFLSFDVQIGEDWWEKHNRSYFMWEHGKPPEVVIEIVSNTKGQELDRKLQEYARIKVLYYVVFDPINQLEEGVLRMHKLEETTYRAMKEDTWMSGIELGLTLWDGTYEGYAGQWLRWCDQAGNVILTGAERAEQMRAELDTMMQRASKMATRLRELGIDPDEL